MSEICFITSFMLSISFFCPISVLEFLFAYPLFWVWSNFKSFANNCSPVVASHYSLFDRCLYFVLVVVVVFPKEICQSTSVNVCCLTD